MRERPRGAARDHRALLVLVALVLPVVAHAGLARTGDAIVQFTATGPGGLRIIGKSGELRVIDTGAAVKVTAPLAGLKTGIELRDRHLKEKTLQVDRYPNVELEVPRAALKRPPAGGSVTAETDGTLHLHGKAKTIRFKYTVRHEGARLKVEGGFRIDIRDFGIEVPSYMGLKVKPQVDAGAHFWVTEGK